MTPLAELTTDVLSWGTLLAQVAIVLLAIALFARARILDLMQPYALTLALLLTLLGSALTLIYSEIFGLIPCFLCWVQRVFLYPMPIILGLAIWKGRDALRKLVLWLSVPGALIALYQHYLQVGGTSFVPCPAVPGAADCGQRFIFEFGYITFPLMAVTIFVVVFLLMLVAGRKPA